MTAVKKIHLIINLLIPKERLQNKDAPKVRIKIPKEK